MRPWARPRAPSNGWPARPGGRRPQPGADSLAALAGVVETLWARDGALEIEILSCDAAHLSFNVTGCRYAEMYARMGVRDCGFALSCSRDAAFGAGFNPGIRLQRRWTIMGGARFCDFRFTLDG
ncbi:MAG: L-2-amino-thiazoline-4-carboxylic acid hydrolase [Desulfobacterales bacterium]|nr:L-2-amino-thiazoline-4-carboxylic acid hydrolase [Desulfobacterales bacterium]